LREVSKLIELRLQQLEDNIKQDLELLHGYEDALRYASDPRTIAKYRREIERQREAWARYQLEYNELQKKVIDNPLIQTGTAAELLQQVNTTLDQMDAKLDSLQEGQASILNELGEMRQAVLARFDTSEQKIIASAVEKLSQEQLSDVQIILDHIEANRAQEEKLTEALNDIQQALSEIEKQTMNSASLQLANDVRNLSKVFDDPKLDYAHKLKVSVPIIPLILSYEGEIGLGSALNLKNAWNRLRRK